MSAGTSRSVLLIGLGTAIVPLDSAVNIAFPAITRAFGLPLPAIQWLVVAYVLTYAGLLLAMGRIGDLAGHLIVFRAGLAWSALALAACALAPSYPLLLAARVAQGIGSALVLACGPALLTQLYRDSDRTRALGHYTMLFALSAALGPLLGGVLVACWGWPAVYWFRVPIALAALLLPRQAAPAPRGGFDRAAFDLAGAVLLALALAALILAIDRLREAAAVEAAALLLAAILAFAGFFRRQRRAAQPIIDVAVFRAPGFALVNLGSVLVNLASFAVLLLVPYELARIAALPDTLAGGVLAASGLGTVVGSPLGAALARRSGASAVTALGAVLAAAGLALVALGGTASLAILLLGLALQGLGLGLFQVAYMDIVTGTIAPGARGVAGSLALLTRTVGLVLGASLLSLAYAAFASAALAGGSTSRAAFIAGFRLAFVAAAALPAMFALLEALRLARRR
ncbi:MAG TPA: MFS transporter [Stellaceae bacterium]|nr:MFS transporter [Stellaceae bacterium]